MGYPFDRLVPSYATAIGTSGDRPDALAELMGIVVNNGIRLPTVRIERLRFAADTPYETIVEADPPEPVRVLRPEIAAVVRRALVDTVESGTARSEEHTSELQSLMRHSYAGFCLKKTTNTSKHYNTK